MTFPEAPQSLLTPAPELAPLGETDKLSDLLENVNDNYGNYHVLQVKYLAWQQWYKEQKKIFEEVK